MTKIRDDFFTLLRFFLSFIDNQQGRGFCFCFHAFYGNILTFLPFTASTLTFQFLKHYYIALHGLEWTYERKQKIDELGTHQGPLTERLLMSLKLFGDICSLRKWGFQSLNPNYFDFNYKSFQYRLHTFEQKKKKIKLV